MKNIRFASTLLLVSTFLAFSGCGSDDSSSKKPVAMSEHQAFEAKYADMCVNQELALRKKEHQANPGADEALKRLCTCIAEEEGKRLTKQEAKKFVEQNEYPMSLMIKAGQAEEVCSKK